jgi:hypothetical protein
MNVEEVGEVEFEKRKIIPTTVREGVLFFVRSTFGTTTLISGPFEIGFSHVQDQTAAKACGGCSRDC